VKTGEGDRAQRSGSDVRHPIERKGMRAAQRTVLKRIVGLLGGKIQLGMIAQHPVERTVHVWDKPHVITVYQKSKCVWIAVGDYMGERIEVKGSSASSAAKWWADAARFKGN